MQTVTTLSELVEWIAKAPPHRVLGIVGPPGSGKSTLAANLSAELDFPHAVIPMDGFHYPQARLVELGRRERMGAPDTFDAPALATKLVEAKEGLATVFFPEFDRTIEEPTEARIAVKPQDSLIIVEGNYLLLDDPHWRPVGDVLDASVYVDIPDSVRIPRLIKRHVDFGKSLDDATAWVHRVDNANAAIVAASATNASVIYRPADDTD